MKYSRLSFFIQMMHDRLKPDGHIKVQTFGSLSIIFQVTLEITYGNLSITFQVTLEIFQCLSGLQPLFMNFELQKRYLKNYFNSIWHFNPIFDSYVPFTFVIVGGLLNSLSVTETLIWVFSLEVLCMEYFHVDCMVFKTGIPSGIKKCLKWPWSLNKFKVFVGRGRRFSEFAHYI